MSMFASSNASTMLVKLKQPSRLVRRCIRLEACARLTHFTTEAGPAGIAETGAINASQGTFAGIPGLGGLFGPGVYIARVGPPLDLFIRAAARIPIALQTPAGTARIIPYLVYVRWGTAPLLLP